LKSGFPIWSVSVPYGGVVAGAVPRECRAGGPVALQVERLATDQLAESIIPAACCERLGVHVEREIGA